MEFHSFIVKRLQRKSRLEVYFECCSDQIGLLSTIHANLTQSCGSLATVELVNLVQCRSTTGVAIQVGTRSDSSGSVLTRCCHRAVTVASSTFPFALRGSASLAESQTFRHQRPDKSALDLVGRVVVARNQSGPQSPRVHPTRRFVRTDSLSAPAVRVVKQSRQWWLKVQNLEQLVLLRLVQALVGVRTREVLTWRWTSSQRVVAFCLQGWTLLSCSIGPLARVAARGSRF